MVRRIKDLLRQHWSEPLAARDEADLEGQDTLERHREIIQGKALLRQVYQDWYREYAHALTATESQSALPAIELGSGAGIVSEFFPKIVRTDIVERPGLQSVRAEKMPYADRSLRAILMIDVLHHLPAPQDFFREATRCLAPGGRVLMVEPANGLWSRAIWTSFHPSENFDPEVPHWESQTRGRLAGANMAIPWIIFVRDRARFEREFPGLRIRSLRTHSAFKYLLTGGLSYRAFVPPVVGRALFWLDDCLTRFFPFLGTMMTVELERAASEVAESPQKRAG